MLAGRHGAVIGSVDLVRFGFFVRMTQAFATVGEMQAHCCSCRLGILTGYRIVDLLVLTTEALLIMRLIVVSETR